GDPPRHGHHRGARARGHQRRAGGGGGQHPGLRPHRPGEHARAQGAGVRRRGARHGRPTGLPHVPPDPAQRRPAPPRPGPPPPVPAPVAAAYATPLEAALSFLGLSPRPPEPSWGSMLNTGRSFLYQAPWYGLFPGIMITLAVLSLNGLADGLQRAFAGGALGGA